uniref:DUF4422 domain-containing protein n=1 Tax=Acinetobacter ursingii TaxID=108980 RepID=UPI003009E611
MKTEIYIATHKDYSFPQIAGYIPIHVGKDLTDLNLGIIGDNTGDNISSLNPNFCELTALYWMWKNSSADYLGLIHYRRFFSIDGVKHISIEKIEEMMSSNTVVLAELLKFKKYKFFKYSVENHYKEFQVAKDWDILKEVVNELYPEYIFSFEKIARGNELAAYNMFIGSKSFVNSYCKWLFSILFEVRKRVDLKNHTDYQLRIFGFMSERLLHIYVDKHRHELDIKFMEVIQEL